MAKPNVVGCSWRDGCSPQKVTSWVSLDVFVYGVVVTPFSIDELLACNRDGDETMFCLFPAKRNGVSVARHVGCLGLADLLLIARRARNISTRNVHGRQDNVVRNSEESTIEEWQTSQLSLLTQGHHFARQHILGC